MKVIPLHDLPPDSLRVDALRFAAHSDGYRLGAVVGADAAVPSVRWLQVPSGQEIARRESSRQAPGRARPVLSPDLSLLARVEPMPGVAGRYLLALERTFANPLQHRRVPFEPLNSMAFAPDGLLLWGVADGCVAAFDTDSFFTAEYANGSYNYDPARPDAAHSDEFDALRTLMSAGGAGGRLSVVASTEMYAVTQPNGRVRLCYVGDWCGWVDPLNPPAAVTALAFTPGGRRLVVAHGVSVGVWRVTYPDDSSLADSNTSDHVLQLVLPPHPAEVTGIAVTPDGYTFATSCLDGYVRLWDAVSGEEKAAFNWKQGPLTAVAFSDEGHLGAVGSANGRIMLWDVA